MRHGEVFRRLLPPLLVALWCFPALAASFQRPVAGWHTYSNDKYGYAIQYPAGFELRVTGPEGERDGADILIVRENYAALAPALHIRIEPRTPLERFPSLGTEAADMSVRLDDVRVHGFPAKRAEYRWKVNDDLAFVEILLDGVLFRFDAAPGTRELPETPWWTIVSTFRFLGAVGVRMSFDPVDETPSVTLVS